jgi:hypothetical protein
LGDWYQWERGVVEEGCRRVNMVQTLYVNGKMISVETIPGMGDGGRKKNDGGGEFNYDIFAIL